MTPRTQMMWIDLEDSLEVNLKFIQEHNQNVFLVGKDNLDEFVGIVYAKDILNELLANKPLDLEKLMHKPMFVPRAMESFRVLEKFRESEINEAVVLDEYGGVVGFITIFDIINEVLGDITGKPVANSPQIFNEMNILGILMDFLILTISKKNSISKYCQMKTVDISKLWVALLLPILVTFLKSVKKSSGINPF